MLDPTTTAALTAMGMYLYLSVALARSQVGGPSSGAKPQVFAELRTEPEVLQVRGRLAYTAEAETEGPPGQPYDSVEAYFPVATPREAGRYIVGWRPVVQAHKCPDGSSVELVHHMNVLAVSAQAHALAHAANRGPTELRAFQAEVNSPNDDEPGTGYRFVASYDRGAQEYRLPPGYGIPFGDHFVLEYHLLRPHCWDFAASALESSGFDLLVSHEQLRPAGLFGFTSEDMRIEPLHGFVEHVTELPPSAWPQAGNLEVLALHPHTHDLTHSKQVDVYGAHGEGALWSSPVEPAGYGPTQSLRNLPEPLVLAPGTRLQMRCTYATDALAAPLLDGTSWGQEMCSLLFLAAMPGTPALTDLSYEGAGEDAEVPAWRRLWAGLVAGLASGFRRLL